MKWLFFILLLINIGLFVWIYPQLIEPETKHEVAHSSGGESLLLLAELKEDVLDSPERDDAIEDLQGEVILEDETESSNDEAEMLSEDKPDLSVLKDQISEAEPSTPLEVVEIEEESTGPLAEGPSMNQEASSELTPEPEADIVEPPLHCGRVGPLGTRAQADQLSLRFRALGLESELNSELSNDQEGYWVLVPPQKNRAVAVSIVKRLQEAGVVDLWRFTSGKLAHAISLGLFRNEARAEIRRKSIADKGFEVEVRPRYRQKTHYWLSYHYSGDSPLEEEKWQGLVKRYPGIEQRNVDCQEIARQ